MEVVLDGKYLCNECNMVVQGTRFGGDWYLTCQTKSCSEHNKVYLIPKIKLKEVKIAEVK